MVKDINKAYDKLVTRVIEVNEGFVKVFNGVACPNEWLSKKGCFKRALYDELDSCIRPVDDDHIVDVETFKTNLVKSIEYIRNYPWYDYDSDIRKDRIAVGNELVLYARKFGMEINRIEC